MQRSSSVKAHRLFNHLTLGLRVIKKKKKKNIMKVIMKKTVGNKGEEGRGTNRRRRRAVRSGSLRLKLSDTPQKHVINMLQVVPCPLGSGTTPVQKCAAVPRRARVYGSQTCVSLNSRLESNEEEARAQVLSTQAKVPKTFQIVSFSLGRGMHRRRRRAVPSGSRPSGSR